MINQAIQNREVENATITLLEEVDAFIQQSQSLLKTTNEAQPHADSQPTAWALSMPIGTMVFVGVAGYVLLRVLLK